jgi:DeoR/GlpR family transcriptional regulator of sugar metabolism
VGISADLYLMVPTGTHDKAGLTAVDPDETALRRLLMSRAASTYVLGSTGKIGSVPPYMIGGLSGVEGIVTDAPSDHPTIQQFRQQEVDILPAT